MTSNQPRTTIAPTHQHRTNDKMVHKAEHISAMLVTVTYTDMTKKTMSVDEYRLMHKEVVAK